MNRILLIDLNWTYNRFYYIMTQQGHSDTATATNRGVLEFFTRIQRTHQFSKVFVLVDGRHPRTVLENEGYKANRANKSTVYCKLDEFCKACASIPNTVVLQNDQAEADELIAYICAKHHEHARITIYSGDKDLLQLAVYPSVWFSNSYKQGHFHELTREEVLKKFGTKKEHINRYEDILIYKVLRGDLSDNIPPPIQRLQFKKIQLFLDKLVGSPLMSRESFKYAVEQIQKEDKKFAQQLLEKEEEIFRNYKLMSLVDFAGKEYIKEGVKRW